jgi:hypothetical protein
MIQLVNAPPPPGSAEAKQIFCQVEMSRMIEADQTAWQPGLGCLICSLISLAAAYMQILSPQVIFSPVRDCSRCLVAEVSKTKLFRIKINI